MPIGSRGGIPLVAALLLACGGADRDAGVQDSLGRDLSLAPADSGLELNDVPADPARDVQPPAPPASGRNARSSPPPASVPPAASPSPAPAPPPAPAPAPSSPGRGSGTLSAGTSLVLAAIDSFSTQTHKPGQTVTARVAEDVKDDRGRTVVPAGAVVTLTISQLEVSENVNDPGKLQLRASSVSFGGATYDLAGTSSEVEHTLKGRGVKAGDAVKVGAGAAAGAVVGRVISGKKKGAVVGGVVGAAAGAAAAATTYDRDVIVAAGARIVLKLTDAITI